MLCNCKLLYIYTKTDSFQKQLTTLPVSTLIKLSHNYNQTFSQSFSQLLFQIEDPVNHWHNQWADQSPAYTTQYSTITGWLPLKTTLGHLNSKNLMQKLYFLQMFEILNFAHSVCILPPCLKNRQGIFQGRWPMIVSSYLKLICESVGLAHSVCHVYNWAFMLHMNPKLSDKCDIQLCKITSCIPLFCHTLL